MQKILPHLFLSYLLSITYATQCFQNRNDKLNPLPMRTFLNLDTYSVQAFLDKSGISTPTQYGYAMLLKGEIAKLEDRLSKLKVGSPQYKTLSERCNELNLRYTILTLNNTPPDIVERAMQAPIIPYRDSTLKK